MPDRLEVTLRWIDRRLLLADAEQRGGGRKAREECTPEHQEDRFCDSPSISSSVSTSSTREYGFSISRVRGRSRSSSADSDGTPEKMITGTSAGVDTTTSRPDPRRRRRSTAAASSPVLRHASSPPAAGSAVT